jgi:hypothetical protein
MNDITRAEARRFVLSSRENLRLGFEVEDAMLGGAPEKIAIAPRGGPGRPESGVRRVLIEAVFSQLGKCVLGRLREGWEIVPVFGEGQRFFGEYNGVVVRRTTWPDYEHDGKKSPAGVGLEANLAYWRNMCVGFYAHKYSFPELPHVRSALDQPHLIANPAPASEWCPIWGYLDPPFLDWWDRNFLMEIAYPAYEAGLAEKAVVPPEIDSLGERLAAISLAVPIDWWRKA